MGNGTMTAPEKAIDIIWKFRTIVAGKKDIKQCAIIAVDEILQIVPSVYVTKDEEIHSGHYQYWQEVKQEIEKL